MQYDPEHGSPWDALAGILIALTMAYAAGSMAGRSTTPDIVSFQDLAKPHKGRNNPKGQPIVEAANDVAALGADGLPAVER